MKLFPGLPDAIMTEIGPTMVEVVTSHNNRGTPYLCPLCNEDIEYDEVHVVAIPSNTPRLRRHIHGECLEANIKYGVDITLHPNSRDAVTYVR